MSPPNLDFLLGEVRQLNGTVRAGGSQAIEAFHRLTNRLLHLTVLRTGETVKLIRLAGNPTRAALQSRTADEPLRLNDGGFLRLSARLFLDLSSEPHYLKVEDISYQYQLDSEGRQWIFRYDYLRNPPHAYPASHFQIRGSLREQEAAGGRPLEKFHFPTGRVSLEAVVRLLIEQFNVQSRQPSAIWRPLKISRP